MRAGEVRVRVAESRPTADERRDVRIENSSRTQHDKIGLECGQPEFLPQHLEARRRVVRVCSHIAIEQASYAGDFVLK